MLIASSAVVARPAAAEFRLWLDHSPTLIAVETTSIPTFPLRGKENQADGELASAHALRESAKNPSVEVWAAHWKREPAGLAWTDTALKLIQKYQQNPLRAARALALLHAAMHDASVMAARTGSEAAPQLAALHVAAARTVAYLYPQKPAGKYEALGVSAVTALALQPNVAIAKITQGMRIGEEVASAAIARALNDGADQVRDLNGRPALKAGLWRATPPLFIHNPAEPKAGTWRTWAFAEASQFQPPPPVKYDSEEYWKEVDQVAQVTARLTAEQKEIAERWNLDKGTVTPAGVWNLIGADLVKEFQLDTLASARVFATLNAAMMDAFIACWRAKFTWWTQRPITAIRERIAPEFTSYLITPAFPSYVSGHATVSGAAAAVLSRFFPDRRGELMKQAEEAAASRLFGGIHFASDNDEGLKLGRRIGEFVASSAGLR